MGGGGGGGGMQANTEIQLRLELLHELVNSEPNISQLRSLCESDLFLIKEESYYNAGISANGGELIKQNRAPSLSANKKYVEHQ